MKKMINNFCTVKAIIPLKYNLHEIFVKLCLLFVATFNI